MIRSLGRHALSVTTVLAVGGLGGAVAVQAPAQASVFTTAYTCNIGDLGQTAAVLNGWLIAPGTAYSGPARFQLRVSSLNVQAPLAIDSWSGTAWINVSGAENTSFLMSGYGGAVPAQGALVGDLAGDWAPTVAGTDLLSVGGIEITAHTPEAGNIVVQCVPNDASVAEVLRVASPYRGRWVHPPVPIFHVGPWYRPGMVLRRPMWVRPGWNHPGWNHPGWNRPGIPAHTDDHAGVPVRTGGEWNRPGWNRPGLPVRTENHPAVPVRTGDWNRPGFPAHHSELYRGPYHR